ncbi:DNA methylase [Vigna unguiculata]|uniref:DNA methylase n=1 Tax=Vigna unguiculata TaxID=3917 RepID=A0A4D6MZ09_VIGUN|nr:DNA methylase [Vigna unguiculata]
MTHNTTDTVGNLIFNDVDVLQELQTPNNMLHNYPMAEVMWIMSQFKNGIPCSTISKAEIVAGGINCFVVEAKWVKS